MVELTFDVAGGDEYPVRAGDVGSGENGDFTLTVGTPYTPQDLQSGTGGLPAVAQALGVDIGSAKGAKFFRVPLERGGDVMETAVAPEPAI